MGRPTCRLTGARARPVRVRILPHDPGFGAIFCPSGGFHQIACRAAIPTGNAGRIHRNAALAGMQHGVPCVFGKREIAVSRSVGGYSSPFPAVRIFSRFSFESMGSCESDPQITSSDSTSPCHLIDVPGRSFQRRSDLRAGLLSEVGKVPYPPPGIPSPVGTRCRCRGDSAH